VTHDDETRASWVRYREKTLTADLSRGLSDLLAAVQPDTSQSYERSSADLSAKLRQLQNSRALAIKEIQRLEAALREAEQQLQRSPIEQIQKLGQQLRDLSAKRQQLQGECTRLEQSVEATQKNLKKMKDEMEKARSSGAIAQKERLLQKGRARAERLRLLIHDSREVLSKSFHRILQESVSEYYDHSATDCSRAKISRTTLLPAIESNGQIHGKACCLR
jgi:chromosome segregation ATPase